MYSYILNIDITEADLNSVYTLGHSPNSPIKIELISNLKKSLILRNCSKLKDTGIRISHDQTVQQREENRILRRHLNKLKENTNNKCYIKRNILYINDTPHRVEDIQKLQEENILQETAQEDNRINLQKSDSTPQCVLEFQQGEEQKKINKKKNTGKKYDKKTIPEVVSEEGHTATSQPQETVKVHSESSERGKTRSAYK